MTAGRWVGLLGIVACGAPGPGDDGSPDGGTTNAEVSPKLGGAPSELDVACVGAEDNALRFTCTVTVDPPQPVALSWSAGDGDPGGHESAEVVGEHVIPVRFLRPKTTYTAVASAGGVERTTTFTTGELPPGVWIKYTVEGESSVRRLFHATACRNAGFVVVSDTAGATLWYQEVGVGPGAEILSASITEDDTVLAVLAYAQPPYDAIVEVDWDGNVLFYAEYGTHYDQHVHHDAFKRAGHIYAVFADPRDFDGATVKGDGFYVFDPDAEIVAEWRLFDHASPPAPPEPLPAGAFVDYSHTNAITVSEDLQVTISMRHLSAVAGIEGDWISPEFGEIRWRLSGNPSDRVFGSDWTITASAGGWASFVQQHHAQRIGDRVLLFDNRLPPAPSRVIGLQLDAATGTADIDEVYNFALNCPYQGGVYETAAGHRFGTCAPLGRLLEWEPGASEARYALTTSCVGGVDADVPRFFPMERP